MVIPLISIKHDWPLCKADCKHCRLLTNTQRPCTAFHVSGCFCCRSSKSRQTDRHLEILRLIIRIGLWNSHPNWTASITCPRKLSWCSWKVGLCLKFKILSEPLIHVILNQNLMILLPSEARDGSGQKRIWLQSTMRVKLLQRGEICRPLMRCRSKGKYGGPGGGAPGSCCKFYTVYALGGVSSSANWLYRTIPGEGGM